MVYTDRMHVRGFLPEIGCNPHTLVLGSMPGIRSIEAGEYYAHPRNAFWRIAGSLGLTHPDAAYSDRLRTLLAHGIALWDVLDRCERSGSLDSSIRTASETANDVRGLLAEHATIRRVLLNGAKAQQAFERHVRPTLDERLAARIAVIRVPSTSPAHAVAFEEKLDAWQRAMAVTLPSATGNAGQG